MVQNNWDMEPQDLENSVKAIDYVTTAIEGIEKHF